MKHVLLKAFSALLCRESLQCNAVYKAIPFTLLDRLDRSLLHFFFTSTYQSCSWVHLRVPPCPNFQCLFISNTFSLVFYPFTWRSLHYPRASTLAAISHSLFCLSHSQLYAHVVLTKKKILNRKRERIKHINQTKE